MTPSFLKINNRLKIKQTSKYTLIQKSNRPINLMFANLSLKKTQNGLIKFQTAKKHLINYKK